MYSISYAADQCYITPNSSGSPTYENAKQVQAAPMRLVNSYAFNTSGSTVYLAVMDSADAGVTLGRQSVVVYPIAAGGYVALSQHGGAGMSKGLYVKAFTDLALTAAAGSIMFYKFDWMDKV